MADTLAGSMLIWFWAMMYPRNDTLDAWNSHFSAFTKSLFSSSRWSTWRTCCSCSAGFQEKISQIKFCEYGGTLERDKSRADQGQRMLIFYGNNIQTPVIDAWSQCGAWSILLPHKEERCTDRRGRGSNDAQGLPYILFHGFAFRFGKVIQPTTGE